jgi:poly(3-hydroxyalkanoate) depolymerase
MSAPRSGNIPLSAPGDDAASGANAPIGLQVRDVDIDGQRLRVGASSVKDSLAQMLIFNGIGANLELVQPFVSLLRRVDVTIFDIPGVGGSPAPALPYRLGWLAGLANKLMTKLGHSDPFDVLGVSWGGALAQQFAHQFPDRCRRLILASTSPGALMVPGKLSVLATLASPRRYADPEFLAKVGGDIYGGAYRRDPELLRNHSQHIRSPGGRGYVYQLLAAMGWSSLPWLGSLRQPTLVMHGNDDPIVPLINAKILTRRIPDARLSVFDDGHLFLISRAAEAAAAVDRFLCQDTA